MEDTNKAPKITGEEANSLPVSVSTPAIPSKPKLPKVPPTKKHIFHTGGVRDIQVNYCKNPTCENFGIAPTGAKGDHKSVKGSAIVKGENYTLSGSKHTGVFSMVCKCCGEKLALKSNVGIDQEITRITAYLESGNKKDRCCSNPDCSNHTVPLSAGTEFYYAFGKSDAGSKRYRCRACNKTFSQSPRTTLRQRKIQVNAKVFKMLVNKVPFACLCDIEDISIPTLYKKIDFIHQQCLAFAGYQERKLAKVIKGTKRYVSVDRQETTVNWSNKKNKRNIVLRAIGSADMESSYIFGMHLNFDGSQDPALIEAEQISSGDLDLPAIFRKHAHYWLKDDYAEAMASSVERAKLKATKPNETIGDAISISYLDAELRKDTESTELIHKTEMLPITGVQIKSEYTMYAHFYHLHELLKNAEKVRFFLDQDSGIRASCFAGFEKEIKARTCDVFFVKISKDKTQPQKQSLYNQAKKSFSAELSKNPTLTTYEVMVNMMKQSMKESTQIGIWGDKWVGHPMPSLEEPEKAVCLLTDYGDYDEDHLANLYLKADMRAIDRFFNQLRRKVSLLERPVGTASSEGRMWYGYAAYKPDNIQKLQDIYRTFFNYTKVGKDKKTPAMRLGLIDKPVSLPTILAFNK